MSKRKYLFNRGDSYRDTGIPCGNPRRVGSGEVLCMPSGSGGLRPGRGDPQAEDLETEGERHLRAMAQKQLKTDLTVDELLSQRREFAHAGKYAPLVQEVRGALQLPEYEEVVEGDRRLEALRQYGLTEEEVRLQLAEEGVQLAGYSPAAGKASYGADPQVARDRLAAIESRMQAKDALLEAPDTFRDQKRLSRQELDLERSLFRGTSRDSRRALPRLLTSRTGGRAEAEEAAGAGPPADPARLLPELMAVVEERARESLREKRRRRRRQRRRGQKALDDDDRAEDENGQDGQGRDAGNAAASDEESADGDVAGCLSLEEALALKAAERSAAGSDDVEATAGSEPKVAVAAAAAESGMAQPIEKAAEKGNDSSRTVLKDPIEFFPEEFIKGNRMTVNEIKQDPKFENYDPGQPNNVLYLKNLSPRVRERDLVSMFGRFQKDSEPEIVFRLMTGRMRGQAFVTFHSPEVASQALQLLNGFLLHGQPVIVQYGKRTAACPDLT